MNIVLINPEIPPNTGNIARLCAVTQSTLHLIEPFGFELNDKDLKRAGMDYWQHLEWYRWPDWIHFEEYAKQRSSSPSEPRFWMVECKGEKRYDEVHWESNDYIVLGRETKGIPKVLLERYKDFWIRIPMFNPFDIVDETNRERQDDDLIHRLQEYLKQQQFNEFITRHQSAECNREKHD